MNKKNKGFDFSIKDKKEKKESDLLIDLLKIADEVYKARLHAKLSQQGLAKKIGTTQAVISRIENGEINFGVDLMVRLSKALKIQASFGDFYSLPNLKKEPAFYGIIATKNLEDTTKDELEAIYNSNDEATHYLSLPCENALVLT
jgi:transcriptional regulator with XRE-family HTH domain